MCPDSKLVIFHVVCKLTTKTREIIEEILPNRSSGHCLLPPSIRKKIKGIKLPAHCRVLQGFILSYCPASCFIHQYSLSFRKVQNKLGSSEPSNSHRCHIMFTTCVFSMFFSWTFSLQVQTVQFPVTARFSLWGSVALLFLRTALLYIVCVTSSFKYGVYLACMSCFSSGNK